MYSQLKSSFNLIPWTLWRAICTIELLVVLYLVSVRAAGGWGDCQIFWVGWHSEEKHNHEPLETTLITAGGLVHWPGKVHMAWVSLQGHHFHKILRVSVTLAPKR